MLDQYKSEITSSDNFSAHFNKKFNQDMFNSGRDETCRQRDKYYLIHMCSLHTLYADTP